MISVYKILNEWLGLCQPFIVYILVIWRNILGITWWQDQRTHLMKVDIITESLYSLHNTPSNHPVYTWSLQTADSSVTLDCACPSVTFIQIHGILPGLYLLSSQDFSASWWVSLKSNKNLVGSISAQTPTWTGHYTFGLLLWYHGATTPSHWDSEYLDYMSKYVTGLGYYFATHINLCDKLQSTNTFDRLKLGVVSGGGMKT